MKYLAALLAHSLVFALFLSCSTFGQSLPGLHLIEPDPSTGRPLLVQGVNTIDGDTWEIPIEVYSDSNVALFTAKSYLIASIQLGYSQSGTYDFRLYAHYKNDLLCKRFFLQPDFAASAAVAAKVKVGSPEAMREMERECHLIRYKSMRVTVATRTKMLAVTNRMVLDDHGNHLAFLPGDEDWRPIASLYDPSDDCSVKKCRDIESPYLKTAINRITPLVEREHEYSKRMYGGK
jgi:hypothetical protein